MSDDEARRKTLKPAVSLQTAIDLARTVWGLSPCLNEHTENEIGVPKALDSYDDNNFYMPGTLEGETKPSKYLLKVHNGVESSNAAFLEFQTQMMTTLHAAGIPCPLPVPIPTSSSLLHHQDLPVRGGEEGKEGGGGGGGGRGGGNETATLAVRMLYWVEGTPLVSMPCTGQALINAGAFLGKIDQVLDTFDHIGCHREHIWDLQRIRGLQRFVECVQDPSRRTLIQSVLNAFERKVYPIAPSLRRGVLMSDFNDANIICDAQDAEEIVGVIDFGDSVESWRVNDVAIAMAYAAVSAFGKTRPVQAAACLLKGFVQTYPLNTLEKDSGLLLTLACGRLAISVTLGAYSYQKDPSNTYLLIHSEPAWSALHTLWYSNRNQVEALFNKAMEEEDGSSTSSVQEVVEGTSFPLISKAPAATDG